jgi:Ku70/Ku80 beta-barrel domain
LDSVSKSARIELTPPAERAIQQYGVESATHAAGDARDSWKGCLQLSLVCVPVKAYSTSSSGGGDIHLNQLHAECHRRIQYKKTCPLHGEVTNDQIVSGYEYAQDHYVVVDPDELDRLRTEADKAIKIDVFIASAAFDPLYGTGKRYYLAPDGPAGQLLAFDNGSLNAVSPGGILAARSNVFHHEQGGEQIADFLRQGGVLVGVFRQWRALTAPIALEKFFGQGFDGITFGGGITHESISF